MYNVLRMALVKQGPVVDIRREGASVAVSGLLDFAKSKGPGPPDKAACR